MSSDGHIHSCRIPGSITLDSEPGVPRLGHITDYTLPPGCSTERGSGRGTPPPGIPLIQPSAEPAAGDAGDVGTGESTAVLALGDTLRDVLEDTLEDTLQDTLENVLEGAASSGAADALNPAAENSSASGSELGEIVREEAGGGQGLGYTPEEPRLEAGPGPREGSGGGAEAAEEVERGAGHSGAAGGSTAAALLFELAQQRVTGIAGQGIGSAAPPSEELEAALELLALAEAEVAAEDVATADEAGEGAAGQARDITAAQVASTAAATRLIVLAQARVAARAGLSPSEAQSPAARADTALPAGTTAQPDTDPAGDSRSGFATDQVAGGGGSGGGDDDAAAAADVRVSPIPAAESVPSSIATAPLNGTTVVPVRVRGTASPSPKPRSCHWLRSLSNLISQGFGISDLRALLNDLVGAAPPPLLAVHPTRVSRRGLPLPPSALSV